MTEPLLTCLFICPDRENLGSIRVKVRLTQECILPSVFYKPLIEILVSSTTNPKSLEPTALGLLEELNIADHSILAHQLVRLFIGQDMVIPMLDYLTLREIKKSSNIIFRLTLFANFAY